MVEDEKEPWWWAGEHAPGTAGLMVAGWAVLTLCGVARVALDPDPTEPLLWAGVALVLLGVALVGVNVATLVALRRAGGGQRGSDASQPTGHGLRPQG